MPVAQQQRLRVGTADGNDAEAGGVYSKILLGSGDLLLAVSPEDTKIPMSAKASEGTSSSGGTGGRHDTLSATFNSCASDRNCSRWPPGRSR